jgi:hypothetical protein
VTKYEETVDKLLKYLGVMLLRAFLFVVAKALPNVGAVQVGNLDVALKNVLGILPNLFRT